MTKEEVAALVNGRQYGQESDRDLDMKLREAGLIMVYGYSDDNIEFRGAIFDEIGAGGSEPDRIILTQSGLLLSNCDEGEGCPYFQKLKASYKPTITGYWCKEGTDYAWFIETDLPHAVFDILEDDDKFCRGIVISKADLPE